MPPEPGGLDNPDLPSLLHRERVPYGTTSRYRVESGACTSGIPRTSSPAISLDLLIPGSEESLPRSETSSHVPHFRQREVR